MKCHTGEECVGALCQDLGLACFRERLAEHGCKIEQGVVMPLHPDEVPAKVAMTPQQVREKLGLHHPLPLRILISNLQFWIKHQELGFDLDDKETVAMLLRDIEQCIEVLSDIDRYREFISGLDAASNPVDQG